MGLSPGGGSTLFDLSRSDSESDRPGRRSAVSYMCVREKNI